MMKSFYKMNFNSCFNIEDIADRTKRKTSNVDITIDLANWMGDMNDKGNIPINFLVIPGSHDSMSYGISRESNISPDAEAIVKELVKYLKPFVKLVMYKWSVTQSVNVKKQLSLGIRYLDLRIATKANDNDFYFVHGLYGNEVSSGLKEIAEFLKEHEKEIVILDFQHFYSFNDSDHVRLVDLFFNIFGKMLCPQPAIVSDVTLNWMWESKYQVIAIYRNSLARDKQLLWESKMWPTPWPDTMNVGELLQYLNSNLMKRPHHVGYVSQCVLTPQKSTVLINPFSGVMRKCAEPVSKVIIPWIQEAPPLLNVAIADYIEMNSANFSTTLISINYTKNMA